MAEPHRFNEAMNYSFVGVLMYVGAIELTGACTRRALRPLYMLSLALLAI
jgi:hypothetical protein